MQRIIIVDCNQNTFQFFKEDQETDIFIEETILSGVWGPIEEISIDIEEMTKAQIASLNYLDDTDWYIWRFVDPSDGREIPESILNARQSAREIL